MKWRPLLLEPGAEKAIADIACALERAVPSLLERSAQPSPKALSATSLAGGLAGLAIFFQYLAQPRDGLGDADMVQVCLDAATERLATLPMGPSLFLGFTGIAWATEHIERQSGSGEDRNREIDEALLHLLAGSAWTKVNDVIDGLAGLGIYALERLPNPAAENCLAQIVDRLAAEAEATSSGVTWRFTLVSAGDRALARGADRSYNLGMAHGVPGILAFLAQAYRQGVRAATSLSLLERGVQWLLAQENPPGAISRFGAVVSEPRPSSAHSRLAWCYGDLGVAVALVLAGRLAERPDWEEKALEIARHAALRPFDTTGIRDAGLCHGAFGVAHLFNRIFQATGLDVLAEAALSWYRWGLSFRRPGQEMAGFLAYDPDREGNAVWTAEPGLLTGAAGVGLALMAATSAHEPCWDRVLLASSAVAEVGRET